MAHEVSASSTTNAVPQQRTGGDDAAADAPQRGGADGPGRPVPLDRLLSVAVLTPAQASFVAVQLLDAADLSGTVDGEYVGDARLGAVTLTRSGEVDVDRARDGDGTHVTEHIRRLLQNARRLPAHPRPEQVRLLHTLEEAAADPLLEPGRRARDVEGALTDTLGAGARRRISAQLAALVDAFAHVAHSVPAPVDAVQDPHPVRATTAPASTPRATWAASRGSRPASRRGAHARRSPRHSHRGSRVLYHRRRRGWHVALVVLVVVAALGVSGYALLHDPGGDKGVGADGRDGRGGRGTAPNKAAQKPAKHKTEHPSSHPPQTVPALAERQAGPITGVALQKTGSCTPDALCPVKVTVHFRPASTAHAVDWKVGAARLCKGGVTWSAESSVTAQPGWTSVYAYSSVRVPDGHSLALVALTTTPARAQSRPVPVTGRTLQC